MRFYSYIPFPNEVLFASFQWFISYRNHSGNEVKFYAATMLFYTLDNNTVVTAVYWS